MISDKTLLRDVLDTVAVEETLLALKQPLESYVWLQTRFITSPNVLLDYEFRKRYNHFYRVRRGTEWQQPYYSLMEKMRGQNPDFRTILVSLSQNTKRIEASFASKLLATINPISPVIDSVVFGKLGLRLPYNGSSERIDRVCQIFAALSDFFVSALSSDQGIRMVQLFRAAYPGVSITETKILDLLLWKTGR